MSVRIEPTLTRAPAAAAGAPPRPARRDPAPSRVAYRLQRLWLTPLYRALLRKGVPVFLLVFAAGLWMQDEVRRAALSGWIADLRQAVAERPEFMVQLLRIDGASDATAAAIRQRLDLHLPASSWAMDLDAMQAALLDLDAVESARLRIRAGGTLTVSVVERQPAVIWRSASGIGTLDARGHPVAPLLSRLERPDLPLVVGEDAENHIPEALAILAVAGPISDRIRGMVRVGNRRWDVVVDPAIRLMLPAESPVEALEQIIALDQAQQLLSRDILTVDLRLPARPTVQMNGPAAETYRQTSAILQGAARP